MIIGEVIEVGYVKITKKKMVKIEKLRYDIKITMLVKIVFEIWILHGWFSYN